MAVSEKYKIIQELGNQSRRKFGRVFLVENRLTGEKAVLKSLQINDTNSQLATRLIQESQFSFEDKGLPKVLDFEHNDNEILLVIDYKNGVTIDVFWKTIKRKEQITTLKRILKALLPIFEKLKEEHIVHGDIKPSNLLVETKGAEIELHLLDFGLAFRLDDQQEDRQILFPLGFASPEQILNRTGEIDHTSDLFSLGIVIWRLFAGKLPLTHPNPSIFTNLQITHPLPEHELIPQGLFKIISKMCHKHPFQTSPNRMHEAKVDEMLRLAKVNRYESLSAVMMDLEPLTDYRNWLSRVLF